VGRQLSLYEMRLAGAGAAIWFASAVFIPTFLLAAIGKWLRYTLSRH